MVSNYGNVKSMNYNHTGKEKLLKPKVDKDGYLEVLLCVNNKRKHNRVHRLVAIAFIHNPENLPQVNHKDEIRNNNTVDNLEWCTLEYNIKYGSHMKNIKENHAKGKSHQFSKKVICDGIEFVSVKSCADYYDVNASTMRCWLNPNKASSPMRKDFVEMGLSYILKK